MRSCTVGPCGVYLVKLEAGYTFDPTYCVYMRGISFKRLVRAVYNQMNGNFPLKHAVHTPYV